jgi:3-methyladenine DNA glycosylase AlkD
MKPRALAIELAQCLESAGNPGRQRGAQAYMKTSDPFFGVDAATLRRSVKELAKSHPPKNQADYLAQIEAFWSLPQREAHYAAVEWAKLYPAFQTLKALPLFERMIREGAWWDTVDEVARFLIGALLLKERAVMKPVMERWIQDEHLWIRRAALVAHQKHRERADEAQLFDLCLRLAPEKDFFIRKAIGWALREHSKVRPEAVAAFIADHRAELSGLSIREGLKRISASR